MHILLLVGSAAFLAALLSCFDVATKAEEPTYALRTKEWWGLVGANCLVACIVIYVAQESETINLCTFSGWIATVIGYPLLLHAKLFSLRRGDEETPIGPLLLLERAEKFFQPGIEKSINEKAAKWTSKWRNADLSSVSRLAKDYVNSQQSLDNKDEILGWIDRLVEEVEQTPEQKNDNAAALLVKIREIGGLRGVKWILRQNNKKRAAR